jgi:hypothetical protein
MCNMSAAFSQPISTRDISASPRSAIVTPSLGYPLGALLQPGWPDENAAERPGRSTDPVQFPDIWKQPREGNLRGLSFVPGAPVRRRWRPAPTARAA